MEKSLKNKIVSIVSAVALAFCTLLAFFVLPTVDQPKTASASVMGSNQQSYFGNGCWCPFSSSVNQYINANYYTLSSSVWSDGTTPRYRNVGGSGTEIAFGTYSIANVNNVLIPTVGKFNYLGRAFGTSITGTSEYVASAFNYRSPYPPYAYYRYIDNSPLVLYKGITVPMSMIYQGIYLSNSTATTDIMLIYDIYLQGKDAETRDSYLNIYRKLYFPVASLRNSATQHTFVSFADLWIEGMGISANFSDFVGENQKYVFSAISLGGDGETGVGFGVCSNTTAVFDGSLNITTITNPDYHYGHIFVDAVNEFTDIEIGNGLSLKFILLISIGLTLAVALIKMLI